MNWQDIKISSDHTHFLFSGKPLFNKTFMEILKFHSPGLAPVKDESGYYHIGVSGNQLYKERYTRTFGYYCNRAAVADGEKWFHLTEKGEKAYLINFSWAGNYQEGLCTVRDQNNRYFHIDINGVRPYSESYQYCGDFKDGYACVKNINGRYVHIDNFGNKLNEIEFLDLGVFHKNFATAKDEKGWYHIDRNGVEIYKQKYLAIEPFYNGFSVVTKFSNQKEIIDEMGNIILTL